MLIRALIVLLVVLNLGAAAWWLTRPAPTPPAEPVLPAGVARLQLVNEAPSMPTQAPVPQVRDAVPPAALAACFSLGPYTRESSALQAQAAWTRWRAWHPAARRSRSNALRCARIAAHAALAQLVEQPPCKR